MQYSAVRSSGSVAKFCQIWTSDTKFGWLVIGCIEANFCFWNGIPDMEMEVGRNMSGNTNLLGARTTRCGRICSGVRLVLRRYDFVRMNGELFLKEASITQRQNESESYVWNSYEQYAWIDQMWEGRHFADKVFCRQDFCRQGIWKATYFSGISQVRSDLIRQIFCRQGILHARYFADDYSFFLQQSSCSTRFAHFCTVPNWNIEEIFGKKGQF